ncbi:12684_t:CDS:2 [Gigaspora rosea]|nr:12684_t:CDS:2 [Gigaspora rosea]
MSYINMVNLNNKLSTPHIFRNRIEFRRILFGIFRFDVPMLNFVIEMQTFLSIPKFNKKLLYLDANTLYQHFMNTFAYNQMVLTTNPSALKSKLVEEGNKKWREIKKKGNDIIQEEIRVLLNTPISLQAIGVSMNSSHRKSSQPSNLVSTPLSSSIFKKYEIHPNASAQKASHKKLKQQEIRLPNSNLCTI